MKHTTIESFFLADYERLRKENEELKVSALEAEKKTQNTEDGFTDLHKKVEAVYYKVESYYTAFESSSSKANNLTLKQLEAISKKGDNSFFEWATNQPCYYSDTVISVKNRTFPFSLAFKTYKGVEEYVYDPDYDKTLLIKASEEAQLGCWVVAELDKSCKTLAIAKARKYIVDRIEELKKEAEKEVEE